MSSSAVEPLRVPQFRALWLASVVSNVGSFLQSVAAGWLMLELTGSPLWVAAMSATTTLPLLFFALHAGALADVVDRRKVLLAAQVVMGSSAVAMAVLHVLDRLPAPALLGLGLLLGTGLAFNLPAWQAMVPDLVPRGMVASAVALNSVAFNVARAVGPAMGGLVVAIWGPQTAFALNALSYIGVIGVILSLGGAFRAGETTRVGSAVATGIRFARYTPVFRTLLLIAAGFAVTSAAIQAVLPNLTQDVLGGGELMYGVLLGTMGIGALVGAFTRPRVGAHLGGRMVPLSMIGFSLAGIGVGLAPTPILAGLAIAVSGLFWVWTLATLNATVQLLAPPWVRGRAMSLYMLAFTGILPLGALLAGGLGVGIGTAAAITWMSVAGVILGAATTRLRVPSLDEVGEIDHEGDFIPAPHPVAVAGSPVLVLNTWMIADEDLEEFLATMNQVRLVRLRTGALRWRLYRNVAEVHRMTEMVILGSWTEHLAQHRRLDAASSELIRRARAFDTSGGPITRHLAAIDVTDLDHLPGWEELSPLVEDVVDPVGPE
ncbi:MFS transporter [soil metagenome]